MQNKRPTSLSDLKDLDSTILSKVQLQIDAIKGYVLAEFQKVLNSGTFEPFLLERKKNSGLAKKPGFYTLVCSIKPKKYRIGSSKDLGQRRAEHKRDIKKACNDEKNSLSLNMQQDIRENKLSLENFGFTCLYQLTDDQVKFCEEILSPIYKDQSITVFLDWIEESILTELKKDSNKWNILYNVSLTNAFQKGNPGGSHGAGGARVFVSNGFYAWDTLSKAAEDNEKDRHTIKKWAKNGYPSFGPNNERGTWKILSKEEYNEFPEDRRNPSNYKNS
jgi:hypothetical protein